ncbi:TonB-dependent receptor [Solitalea koreensis]|uniref:Iron complex outermembrane recepter protein n=1 Tax=Solitalea koreensis TaxID=543615 RepID=A0A521B0L4_9SPHI|nr:TonB-dependent receptor [Solitalea koreensis]SMO40310.1 iron complex outermembrane recepter protein [Solitalea koreensis]
MKTKSFLLSLIVFFLTLNKLVAGPNPVTTITGKVTDKTTGLPIEAAEVSITSLHIGVNTNSKGMFTLPDVPKSKLLITVSRLGYKSVSMPIDLNAMSIINFEMEPTTVEINEVVVTGSPIQGQNVRNSTAISVVSMKSITSSGATNIVDALGNVPGVSQITTGGAISKPVIRGLSYNRVVTLSNDVKQEGQQWGDEHGIEVDQYSAGKVEVLRGPASLFYGSDALGGVINIIDPVTSPPGSFKGQFITNYSTNNGLTANNLQFEGNYHGFVYRMVGTYKNAMSFATPSERVYNSAFRENNITGMVGVNKSWGYAHLTYSRFNTELGLTDGQRDSTGKFVDNEGNTVSHSELESRSLALPFQHITHNKVALNTNIALGKGFIKTTLGFQNNKRMELEDSPSVPSLFFDLSTYTLDSKYYFPEMNGWAPVIGISGSIQNNRNKGEEALVAGYDSYALGAFAYAKRSWDKLTLDVGLRFDTRKMNGMEEYQFMAFNNTFSNISGSTGLTYQLTDNFHAKANIGRGFRAPNIAELSAQGVHEGTFRYEVGNPALKQETTLQLDGSLGWDGKYFSSELNGYYNMINDFIYYQNTNNEQIDVNGILYPVYRYIQGNSVLKGLEFSFDVHAISSLHFENTFALTRGTNTDTKQDLPFIPQAKLTNELRFNIPKEKKSGLTGSYVSLSIDNNFKQTKVDPFESSSGGYTLLNAALGTTFCSKSGHEWFTIYANGRNLTNRNYIDHLSRFKEIGISNIGRNITFGINVPISN